MRPKNFTVKTSDGIRIAFVLYAGGKKGRSVVVICPGFFQSKDTHTFRQLSRDLAGVSDVVCMDFRGHGRSEGLYTFSAREGKDLEAVLGWVRNRYPTIHLVGFSLGGAVVLNTAARFPEVARTVTAVSAPSSFREIEYRFWTPDAIRTGLRTYGPGVGCRPGPVWLKKERPSDSIRKIFSIPVLLIHGTRDPIITHHHSERLHRTANNPKQLELISGGGHAEELYRENPSKFISLIEKWMTRT